MSRERLRRENAGSYKGEPSVEVLMGKAPEERPAFSSRFPKALQLENSTKKWVAIISGVLTVIGGASITVIEVLDAYREKADKAAKEEKEVSLKALQEQIDTIKAKQNQHLASDNSFREHWGADRKQNVAGEIITDGIDQDKVRVRSESICEKNKPDCRPTWSFTGEGIVKLPKPHP